MKKKPTLDDFHAYLRSRKIPIDSSKKNMANYYRDYLNTL